MVDSIYHWQKFMMELIFWPHISQANMKLSMWVYSPFLWATQGTFWILLLHYERLSHLSKTCCNKTVFTFVCLCLSLYLCVWSIIQVILASAFIPVFSGLSPPRYRGFRVIGNISTADWWRELEFILSSPHCLSFVKIHLCFRRWLLWQPANARHGNRHSVPFQESVKYPFQSDF